MADLRRTLLAFSLYLLLTALQMRFELQAAGHASLSNPVPRVGRALAVRPAGFLPPQGGQVTCAVLAAPPIIQLPPGWAGRYRLEHPSGLLRPSRPILSLRDA